MTVSFHPAARSEIVEARAWYFEWSPISALGFARAVANAVLRTAAAPTRYARAEHGTRRILRERFPFSIYYRETPNRIEVVAVAHQKRLPGYWAQR
jgi:plasmid stabilization system protein ParE